MSMTTLNAYYFSSELTHSNPSELNNVHKMSRLEWKGLYFYAFWNQNRVFFSLNYSIQ